MEYIANFNANFKIQEILKILDSDLTYFIEVEFCFSIYTIIKQYHIYATEDHIVPVGKRL